MGEVLDKILDERAEVNREGRGSPTMDFVGSGVRLNPMD
jgi:hypothetical protein